MRTAAAAGTMIALFFPTGYIDVAQVPVQWVTFFFFQIDTVALLIQFFSQSSLNARWVPK